MKTVTRKSKMFIIIIIEKVTVDIITPESVQQDSKYLHLPIPPSWMPTPCLGHCPLIDLGSGHRP